MTETIKAPCKDKQYYESLANLPCSITPLPPSDRMGKRWQQAQNRSLHASQKKINNTIETMYHEILKPVKLSLNLQNLPVFERDYKHDNTEDALVIHAFMSSNVYFSLECSYNFNYEVHYALNDYRFELELLRFLDFYPLNERAKPIVLKPDFSTFYENVLRAQDRKYITFF